VVQVETGSTRTRKQHALVTVSASARAFASQALAITGVAVRPRRSGEFARSPRLPRLAAAAGARTAARSPLPMMGGAQPRSRAHPRRGRSDLRRAQVRPCAREYGAQRWDRRWLVTVRAPVTRAFRAPQRLGETSQRTDRTSAGGVVLRQLIMGARRWPMSRKRRRSNRRHDVEPDSNRHLRLASDRSRARHIRPRITASSSQIARYSAFISSHWASAASAIDLLLLYCAFRSELMWRSM
jgi:hypothetical protein